jgi:hypothetical protein
MSELTRHATAVGTMLAVAALTVAAPAAAQEKQEKHDDDRTDATVKLSPKNGSSVHGTALIRDDAGEGDMDAHRVEVRLKGLEADATYRVHLHRGTCAEGGPVLLGLDEVHGDPEGQGASTTTLPAEKVAQKMKESQGDRAEMAAGEKAHPPVFVQAHLPGGTPAACGDVPMKEKKGSSGS